MKRNWIEWVLLAVACLSAMAAVGAYWTSFHAAPLGGPASWSQFGDYFSGVLNPVIGIITVVLVVLTLRTTRREAADTRNQMDLQIKHLERQAVLSDMHKRLEGALVEWNRLLDQVAPSEFQRVWLSGGIASSTAITTREIIESGDRLQDLLDRKKAENASDNFAAKEWGVFQRDLIPLLSEIDGYCVAYEKVSKSSHLTDFYRARVRSGARALRVAGYLADSIAERLLKT